MKEIEIYYNSPEGPKMSLIKIKKKEECLKVIKNILDNGGINIIREGDQLFVPWHSVIGVIHPKEV